ncbi:N-acetyltransferase ESCO2-like [Lycorma delicatula]|uniref:N-acetyltransferase ESCO2-like n=1 Tax=Lycorma delicatula TaxID=130591 RepID=UPI003F50E996
MIIPSAVPHSEVYFFLNEQFIAAHEPGIGFSELSLTNHSLEKKQCNSSGKKWHPISENQYQIDAGQKHFGAKECSTCGIVYQLGDPDDEMEHEKYHRDFKTFKHLGWRNEKVVGQYGLDRIILVTTDNKIWWKKVRGILKVIDEELGYTTEEHRVMSNLKVYLYITKNHIVGCLVSTQISHAHKMLISEEEIDICSEDSFPVKCGISRIWTHPIHRRQGIASRLVDTMRKSFFFSYYLSMDDFAFSAPTEDGKYFAKKYTNKSDYLIYTGW